MKTVESQLAEAESGYELTIMRHGIAAPRGALDPHEDSLRPLTPDGKKKIKKIAKGLALAGHKIDWIVTSPFVRAVETAEITLGILAPDSPLDSHDSLRPEGSIEALLTFLGKHPDRRRLLVVGHEPGLSDFAARLTGAGREANFAFKKGGCCLIRFEEFPKWSSGTLIWWLTPSLMRRLVRGAKQRPSS